MFFDSEDTVACRTKEPTDPRPGNQIEERYADITPRARVSVVVIGKLRRSHTGLAIRARNPETATSGKRFREVSWSSIPLSGNPESRSPDPSFERQSSPLCTWGKVTRRRIARGTTSTASVGSEGDRADESPHREPSVSRGAYGELITDKTPTASAESIIRIALSTVIVRARTARPSLAS